MKANKTYRATFFKRGNNLWLRIPKDFVRHYKLKEGSKVRFVRIPNGILLVPYHKNKHWKREQPLEPELRPEYNVKLSKIMKGKHQMENKHWKKELKQSLAEFAKAWNENAKPKKRKKLPYFV